MIAKPQQPNILLIVIDCGRADRFSCYGYHRQTTPNIDAIATEGVLYRQAISPAEWTVPAHASMFTGLLPSQHGAVNLHRYLEPGPPTLAEVLTKHGYRTIAVANHPFLTPQTGLTTGFQVTDSSIGAPGRQDLLHRSLRGGKRVLAKLAGSRNSGARRLNGMLKRWLERAPANRPFFIFTNFLDVHAPYRGLPKAYRRRYMPPALSDDQVARVIDRHYRDVLAGTAPMSETDYVILNNLYDGALSYLDAQLGVLFEDLRRRGILNRTLLIITADHGDNLGDHGLMHHAYSLHDTLLHVPLIIRYPPAFPPGMVVEDVVQTLDLFPTILDVLKITEPDIQNSLVGESLVPTRLPERHRHFAVAELTRPLNEFEKTHPFFDFTPFDRELRALRTDTWKYIRASDGRNELYHVKSDPEEKRNLIGEQPNVESDLRHLMDDFWTEVTPREWAKADPEFDEAVKANLRALGYIE